MTAGAHQGTLFTGRDGRARLVWRLALFFFVASLGVVAVGSLLPAGILTQSFALLVAALLGGWAALALDGRTPNALGFYVDARAARETAGGLALGTAVGLAVVAGIALVGGLSWTSQGGSFAAWSTGAAGALLYLSLPAAAEEALLRGYPLQALADAWGGGAAIVVTALAFSALHYGNPALSALGLGNIAAAGLLLGALYLKTGSLWWATGAHLGWNWAHGYVADVPVSGYELLDAPLYEGVAQGPAWLGGGAFGPEGSAVATVCLVVAAAACWWGPWLRPTVGAVGADALILGLGRDR